MVLIDLLCKYLAYGVRAVNISNITNPHQAGFGWQASYSEDCQRPKKDSF